MLPIPRSRFARGLALLALVAQAAFPALAHAHRRTPPVGGAVALCAGGELRWVRVAPDGRVVDAAPTAPTESRHGTIAGDCVVCAGTAGAHALPAWSPTAPDDRTTGRAGLAAPDAPVGGRARWPAIAARAPPPPR